MSQAFFNKISSIFCLLPPQQSSDRLAQAQTEESSAGDAQHQAVALFEQGQNAHEKGDLNGALKFYQEALKLFPEFPEAEYQRGTALISLGNLAEAEKAFRRAVELRADWSLAWAKLGEVLVDRHSAGNSARFGRIKTALRRNRPRFTKAIELDVNNFRQWSRSPS
jgi:tetratricopeptide (TPR) repeat protein